MYTFYKSLFIGDMLTQWITRSSTLPKLYLFIYFLKSEMNLYPLYEPVIIISEVVFEGQMESIAQ